MDDKKNVAKNLLENSTVKRRKAAKILRKIRDDQFCRELCEAWMIEQDSKHWQTKVEILGAIGQLNCNDSRKSLEKIVFNNDIDFDLVKFAASKAWVRISRSNLNDAQPVIAVINSGSYSAREGALEALGFDRMIPNENSCIEIIEKCWSFGSDRPRGYTDPRYGLAAACAGWRKEIVNAFLIHCLESNDNPLIFVAKNSLNQHYCKLRSEV